MPRRDPLFANAVMKLPFVLTVIWLIMLWIAGGASRADVPGQVVTRAAAWTILVVALLFAPRPRWRRVAPVALFVLAAVLLVAAQLVPLPPAVWTALPGRDLLAQAAVVSGQSQPWRPISISPGATLNSLSSLIVPAVTVLLLAGLTYAERVRLVSIMLWLIAASCVLGLWQFSGARFDHPLINDVYGAVSASFANRNHFALFAALGCLVVPAWAMSDGSRAHWKGPAALGLLVFFILMVLATGSRTGMIVGAIGTIVGLFNVRRPIRAELKRLPRKVALSALVGGGALLALAIWLSITLKRAVAVDRALSMDVGEDLRARALPTVLHMIAKYFPFGSGVGAFDPAYRIEEPDALLSTVYFNQAHDDLLQTVLDGGVVGLLLLLAAVGWWLWKSVKAWRARGSSPEVILPRLGSASLLLILTASATDYPARTPMIMAAIVIAAVWLNDAGRKPSSTPRDQSIARRVASRDRHAR